MAWGSFLTGVVVGWFLERPFGRSNREAADDAASMTVPVAFEGITLDEHHYQMQRAQGRIRQLEADLTTAQGSCRDELAEARSQIERLQAEVERLQSELGRLQPVEPSDLKRIEGIGPKLEGVLNDAGILTYQQLAATDSGRLQTIINQAGDRYRLADPRSWPEQARLAAAEKWDELSRLQDELKGGRQERPPEKGGATPL